MLERFALSCPIGEVAAFTRGVPDGASGWKPSYRFGPGAGILILRQSTLAVPARRELQLASWGFVPEWASGELSPVASVGIERISRNGLFRDAARARRCLIPMSGYFEWQPGRGEAVPYFVHGFEPMIAALGVYTAKTVGRRNLFSVAVVTRDAPNPRRKVPALLQQNDWDAWLGSEPARKPTDFFVQPSAATRRLTDELLRHRVSPRIGAPNPRNVESLIAPVSVDS
ncbi:SOS response-associated peptidase [Subtercola sp. YIM 133946]|uniref:SOS response-associated peptidase n=1 Tax=Subtercola sp. YIM 133946 TaxID=3118909 RepID=UPI002F95213E